MHQSIKTIDSPEFINLQPLDINPLMSSCEIKVLYLGENRNQSYISKEVATEMAKTLRGAPIVGYYREAKEDFGDHGEQIVFDGDGIRFNCLTTPYGFVSPDAKVWFQTFTEQDAFGNEIVREYLMTTGYLWTGQFQECQAALEEGRPHSMELDENTLSGQWSKNYKTNMEFFIINDATFSKLCILGNDVEPCFEGSSITKPEVSLAFTNKVDDNFKKTLYTMMQDLKFALQGGEPAMDDNTTIVNEPVVEPELSTTATLDNSDLDNTDENQVTTVEEQNITPVEPEASVIEEPEEPTQEPQAENFEEKFALLQEEHEALKTKYSDLESQIEALKSLQAEYDELKAFKANVEDKEKDALINRFYMLDDEDKKEVIENKANYSLDDIEAKLSIIYTKKQLAADAAKNEQQTSNSAASAILTYNLQHVVDEEAALPDWVKAVVANEKK